MAGKDLVGKLEKEAKVESRQAVEQLIDIIKNTNENVEIRRLAWRVLEGVYYSTSDSFSAWADQRVMQEGARRP